MSLVMRFDKIVFLVSSYVVYNFYISVVSVYSCPEKYKFKEFYHYTFLPERYTFI